MNNKRIIIDSGHGGEDSGAVGNGIIEKDLTLKISQYIKNRFDELGIQSTMTRDNDITLNPDDRIKKILSIYGNDPDIILISNHINAGAGDGAEVIYALRNNDTLAKNITNELANAGQNIRKYYQRRLPSDPSKDYYYILRNTPNIESVIIEYGFLDSKGDDINQLKNNYEALAEAIVKAVANYIGVPYYAQKNEYYTVKSGDTLYSIAKKFNIPVDKLKNINNLNSNMLSIGQKLKIKESDTNITENYYSVQPGDTLYSISNKYNVSIEDLKKWNNLATNILSIGQRLIIREPKKENANDISTYIVKSGDTLYSIAKKYNTSVSEIKTLNNLLSNTLSIGQELKVPTEVPDYIIYTIERGDTLYSIARKFNTTISDITSINNLTTSNLSIGQKLIIP